MNPARGADAVRIGMLTPSSNTALEPATAALLAGAPGVTAHFARLRVTEIALGPASRAQFDMRPMLAAADLLADAKCHAICWNGTSGGWLGVERDRALVDAIGGHTGIAATTAVLALLEAFDKFAVRRYGLVTPYADDVQRAIVERLAGLGFDCAGERHLGLAANFDFASAPREAIAGMLREVARPRPDALVVLCTNMDASGLAPMLESETDIPVLDSIALALWGAMRAAGASTRPLAAAGRLFAV